MPAAITLWVGSAVMSAPSNEMRPARGGVRPRMERISVVLPEPLEPEQAGDAAGLDLERHAFEHVGLVVGGVDVVDVEPGAHHATPR